MMKLAVLTEVAMPWNSPGMQSARMVFNAERQSTKWSASRGCAEEEGESGEREAPSARAAAEGCEAMAAAMASWNVEVAMTGDLRMCTTRIARTLATSATQSERNENGMILRKSAVSTPVSFAQSARRLIRNGGKKY
jgi:hypothetical protein